MLKMINDQYVRAKQILKEHEEGHNALSQLLIRREVIFDEDLEKIFGKRPWVSRSQEIMAERELESDGEEGTPPPFGTEENKDA